MGAMNLLRRHSSAQPRRPSGPRRFPEQTTFTKQESSSRASHTVHSTEYARDRPRRSAGSTDSGVRWGFGPVRASACPRRGVRVCRHGCRLPAARFGHRRSVRWAPKGSRPVMGRGLTVSGLCETRHSALRDHGRRGPRWSQLGRGRGPRRTKYVCMRICMGAHCSPVSQLVGENQNRCCVSFLGRISWQGNPQNLQNPHGNMRWPRRSLANPIRRCVYSVRAINSIGN